jgi:hypothetical protein
MNDYVPFSNREEWKDIDPIEQDDSDAVVTISYPKECKYSN